MCLCACFQGLGQGRWKILPNFTFLISPGMVMEVFTCQAFYNQYTLHLVVVNDRKKKFLYFVSGWKDDFRPSVFVVTTIEKIP